MDAQAEAGLLYRVILDGDAATVRLLLSDSGVGLSFRNEAGHTSLMASATTERPDIAKLLLAAGADVTERSWQSEYSSLHWALHHPPRNQERVREVVEMLSNNGADVNGTGSNGVTALMLASWFGATDAAELLLRLGATVSKKDNKAATALSMARQRGNAAIAKMLEDVSMGAT